ncbi:MAG: hypothetical protein ACLT63_19890 [Bacteroides xylanisolvens]
METMAVWCKIETLKAVSGRGGHFGLYGPFRVPSPALMSSVNAAKAMMEIFPIRHKEESRLRIEGNDGNVIFNVIVPPKTTEDDQREA